MHKSEQVKCIQMDKSSQIEHGHINTTDSLVAQLVKNLPVVWEPWVRSLGWEHPLGEGTATHTSIFAWRIPMDRGA